MKGKYSFIVSTIFAILGVLSFVMYRINGSYVNEEGMLIEQFAFTPIGLLFIFLAAGFGVYWLDLKGFVKLKYSCIISMGLGILSFVIYHLTSGYDENGYLVEIFIFKPIGVFFTFVAAVCGACMLARYLVGHFKKKGSSVETNGSLLS